MKGTSQTDWKHLEERPDEAIDTSDIPQLHEDFFSNAERRLPSEHAPESPEQLINTVPATT
jgi:hypothetical protein